MDFAPAETQESIVNAFIETFADSICSPVECSDQMICKDHQPFLIAARQPYEYKQGLSRKEALIDDIIRCDANHATSKPCPHGTSRIAWAQPMARRRRIPGSDPPAAALEAVPVTFVNRRYKVA